MKQKKIVYLKMKIGNQKVERLKSARGRQSICDTQLYNEFFRNNLWNKHISPEIKVEFYYIILYYKYGNSLMYSIRLTDIS